MPPEFSAERSEKFSVFKGFIKFREFLTNSAIFRHCRYSREDSKSSRFRGTPPLKNSGIISLFDKAGRLPVPHISPAFLSDFQRKSEETPRRIFMESCPRGRRCSTRNAVWVKPPRVRIPNSPPKKPYRSSTVGLFLFPLERKDVVLPTLKKCSPANRSPGSDGQALGPSAWPPPRRVWSGNPGARRCSPSC